ncbi:MAG: hypothetical protein H6581_14005 [Bacteroidia bacterium]|nr:hypothetical protein [Bacteroidia bacterium]
MKLIFSWICLVVFLVQPPAAGKSDLQVLWNSQVENSCAGAMRFEKTVFTDGDQTNAETHTLRLDCKTDSVRLEDTGQSFSMKLEEELSAALEYYYGDPFVKDYFEVKSVENKTRAVLKQANWDDSPLKEQEFQVDPNTQKLTYVHSKVAKNTWFYDIEIEIWVRFDPDGTFSQYEQHSANKILFFSSGFESSILMKRLN